MSWDEANEACASLGRGWRLPSSSELKTLYKNKNKIGGLNGDVYWGSNYDNEKAWQKNLDYNRREGFAPKYYVAYVRAVKSF